jgi:arginyl-tRNA synthetase
VELPLITLAARFASALEKAFGPEHRGTDPVVRRGQHADYQADVALGLARKLKLPPRDVAQKIVAELDLAGIASKLETAGPGFVNVTLAPEYISKVAGAIAKDARLGVAKTSTPERVVIDYSAPNVAKEMHVGNMRSTIIGDALSRVFEHLGHTVIRQNHLGDWGTPFGMLIEHLVDLGESENLSVADLDAFYKQARKKFDGDPAFAERSRLRVVALQSGDEKTLALWRRLVDESTRYFAKVYDALGVKLRPEDIAGESLYNPMLHGVVAALREAGLLRESDGAQCVFPEGFKNKEGEPLPLIVQKQDGGFGYAATDLAAIRYRIGKLGGTRILYVVGAPQAQHFAMVFAVAKEAGWLAPPVVATHVGFGQILGPDKKMFKTRSGDAVKLIELLDEARGLAKATVTEKNPELDEATRDDVARMIGMGSIKYADLSSDRVKDYIFDWKRMLAFEGNTAPYLQYAHARIRSIERRAETKADPSAIAIREPAERALALSLTGFSAAVEDVAATLQPHRLCTYLYDVANGFTSFYETCPVLKAPDEATRLSRLALSDVTARVLAQGLELLGIEAPERM